MLVASNGRLTSSIRSVVSVVWSGSISVQHDTSTHAIATKMAWGSPTLRPTDRWGVNHNFKFFCGRCSVHGLFSSFPLSCPKFEATSGMGGVKGNCTVAYSVMYIFMHVNCIATYANLFGSRSNHCKVKQRALATACRRLEANNVDTWAPDCIVTRNKGRIVHTFISCYGILHLSYIMFCIYLFFYFMENILYLIILYVMI